MVRQKEREKIQADLSAQVDAAIPVQREIAQSGRLNDAVSNLLAVEKQCRNAEDHASTSKAAVAICRLCFEAKDWKFLIQNLHVLAKRRGQLKTVVQDFVQEVMTYLDKVDHDVKMELISELRSITDGKIYVEIERARLTRTLAKIREDEGKLAEAADILQEIQVETFGQMDKREKAEFILEQMRLCLDNKDFIKAQILSNKINKRLLEDTEFQDIKIRFYELMVRFYLHDFKYIDICRSYLAMYNTPNIKCDEAKLKAYLQLVAVFVMLSPHDPEQSDLMRIISNDKNIDKIENYRDFLKCFLREELMRWPSVEQLYGPVLRQHSIFAEGTESSTLWKDLRNRVVEHNIRVMAKYYDRISAKRLSQLLDLSESESEKFVSNLVSNKTIFAKIDRPAGIVSFRKHKESNEFLNEYASSVSELLSLLDKATHLIQRENMVYKLE
eukprot:TRINITY_DN6907_c0_g1_i1.p1 TRINITY_DN6907_c0_g1~~TRINITY_DN6907_c0_g1_i1.p1  ORF type:complete len:473 (+),score=77.63 TRINITY_DN6907_c0_g1_i1:93-1421(+)